VQTPRGADPSAAVDFSPQIRPSQTGASRSDFERDQTNPGFRKRRFSRLRGTFGMRFDGRRLERPEPAQTPAGRLPGWFQM
jgi:hypothetical protein